MAVCLPGNVWDESKWGVYWCLILCIFEITCAAHWKIKLVLSVWNIIGKGLYVYMFNWLNSKLQAEFALSSFNLCGLVLPSGFPVLQDVGRDCGSSQWTQAQIILTFFLYVYSLGVRFPPMDGSSYGSNFIYVSPWTVNWKPCAGWLAKGSFFITGYI